MDKSVIFKIDKRANKSRSIVFYYFHSESIFTIELLSDGSVLLSYDGENSFTSDSNLKEISVSIMNSFIDFIMPYIHTIQNVYTKMKSIHSRNVEIISFDYILNFKVTKMLNMNKYTKCFSPIFNIENIHAKKGIKMRYKRVSNFNEMDSIDAFICEKINQNKTDIEIIEEIGLNFDMNYEKAKVSYVNYMSQVEMEDNTDFVRRRRQLKSPGFGIIITRSNTFYQVYISKINDLSHVPLLEKYISNMFYLSEGLYVMDKSEMSQCMVSTVIESSFQDIQKQGATGEYIVSENIGENEPNFENQQDGIKISAFKLNDAKTKDNGDVEYNNFDFLTMDSNENEGSSSTSRDEKSSSKAKI